MGRQGGGWAKVEVGPSRGGREGFYDRSGGLGSGAGARRAGSVTMGSTKRIAEHMVPGTSRAYRRDAKDRGVRARNVLSETGRWPKTRWAVSPAIGLRLAGQREDSCAAAQIARGEEEKPSTPWVSGSALGLRRSTRAPGARGPRRLDRLAGRLIRFSALSSPHYKL